MRYEYTLGFINVEKKKGVLLRTKSFEAIPCNKERASLPLESENHMVEKYDTQINERYESGITLFFRIETLNNQYK